MCWIPWKKFVRWKLNILESWIDRNKRDENRISIGNGWLNPSMNSLDILIMLSSVDG